MTENETGLVLEGGGLRGVYTSGVLRFFMDHQISFPYVIGVSMGACNGANYIAKQPERNRIVNIRYIKDSRYISYLRLLLGGELFGMDFLFDTIPNSLVPFDFHTFFQNKTRFITTVTDCESGKPLYFEKEGSEQRSLELLRASCSLPILTRPVYYNGKVLMDGGISDSVPLEKSISDGNNKNVIILTRPKGYRKKKSNFGWFLRLRYPKFKGLIDSFEKRHLVYNKTMDLIEQLELQKKVFLIRPDKSLSVGRITRNKDKLYAAYDQGYSDMAVCKDKLLEFLEGT